MNPLDAICLGIIIWHTWRGYQKGLVKTVFSLIGWVVSLFLALHFAPVVAPLLTGMTPGVLQRVLAIIIMLLLSLTGFSMLGFIVNAIFKKLSLMPLNRLAGGGLGAAKGLFIAVILAGMLAPVAGHFAVWQSSQLVKGLLPFAPSVRHMAGQAAQSAAHTLQYEAGHALQTR